MGSSVNAGGALFKSAAKCNVFLSTPTVDGGHVRRETDLDRNGHRSPRVLLATADAATRTGIRLALVERDIVVCGEVESVDDLLESVGRLEPDVCLVDVALPGGATQGVSAVVSGERRPPVVMLAAEPGEEEFISAMRAGAVGYLPKSIPPARLPEVVWAVFKGEPAVPRALVAVLVDRVREQPTRRHLMVPQRQGVDLTIREWQVLDLMREGHSTREIARDLLISEITVRRHIGSVLKKLRVGTRSEALQLLESA